MNQKEWEKCEDPFDMREEINRRAPRHFKEQFMHGDSPVGLSHCKSEVCCETESCYAIHTDCYPLHCDILRMAYPNIEEVCDEND